MSSKRSSGSLFSLSCGCRDSKSVSLSDPSDRSTSTPPPPPPAARSKDPPSSGDTASSSFRLEDDADAPSFSGLLRELSNLERSVTAWAPPDPLETKNQRKHLRSRSEGGARVRKESVAVVKESQDPLSDFRRSMLQMIVEKEIVDREELRELLRRFLALNSPRHHDVIVRAFAEIWNEVFADFEETPDVLRRSRTNYYR